VGAGITGGPPPSVSQHCLAFVERWLVVAQADERMRPVAVERIYSDARLWANGQNLAPCNPPFLVRQSAGNAVSNLQSLLLVFRATLLPFPTLLFSKGPIGFPALGLTSMKTMSVRWLT
jgi:hypothetical protein